MNLLQTIDKQECDRLTAENIIPNFKAGDTIKITIPRVKIPVSDKKGKKMEPVHYEEVIEGICIARTSRGMGSNFILRKILKDTTFEITFPLYGTGKIEVVRYGDVRRAKIYYLRQRSGKEAKIKEKYMHRKA